MHIEPGLVTGTKAILGFAAAAAAGGYALTLGWHALREKGLASLAPRCMIATAAVFAFFEIFPHYPVGVSEGHLILGSTLFLILGAAPATAGLALGLLIQRFGAKSLTSILAFGSAYMLVILIEPVVDLAVLAGAKSLRGLARSDIVTHRLHHAA